MLSYADRVQETTTTSGTGTVTLAGATTGYRSFNSASLSGDTVEYLLVDGTAWEVGQGVFTHSGTDTLTRATILDSTNSGSAISLSGGSTTVSHIVSATSLATALYPGYRAESSGTTTPALLIADHRGWVEVTNNSTTGVAAPTGVFTGYRTTVTNSTTADFATGIAYIPKSTAWELCYNGSTWLTNQSV